MPFDIGWVRSQSPDRRIDWFPTIGSTMTEAGRLAALGCESGTVVGADQQTAGQGRLGRTWHSEAGSGLYVSIVLRRPFPANTLPLVPLALGLATAETILKAAGLTCDLRWPNDVLIGSKKCAGILTQVEGSAVIAGIGINVNHSAFPNDLNATAISLRMASGHVHSRERLLLELLSSVDHLCALLETNGGQPILRMFSLASSFVFGRRVHVDLDDSILTGTTAGLDPSGFLILEGDDGARQVIVAGGVRSCS